MGLPFSFRKDKSREILGEATTQISSGMCHSPGVRDLGRLLLLARRIVVSELLLFSARLALVALSRLSTCGAFMYSLCLQSLFLAVSFSVIASDKI